MTDKENYYGINAQHILAYIIPFDYTELKDGDMIENRDGFQLIYLDDYKTYKIVSNDPSIFLSNKSLQQKWIKRNP